jgi:hypothetical protein
VKSKQPRNRSRRDPNLHRQPEPDRDRRAQATNRAPAPLPPEDQIVRGTIHFVGGDDAATSRADLSPEDKAWADGLAAELVAAVSDPLSPDEEAAADAQVARWDAADERLDALVAAARRGALTLEMEQHDDPKRSRFFILVSDSPRGDFWGERIGEILLGDETSSPEVRDGSEHA